MNNVVANKQTGSHRAAALLGPNGANNMSRSRKITSISGITNAKSEKQDKKLYNRRFRRICNVKVRAFGADDVLPVLREYSNVWAMDKDGKKWFDAAEFPEEMRK
jgi:hypothetical protein